MKKVRPNLRKMFNFHTIILVIIVIVMSTLHSHRSEGKLQRLHKHHHHNHNHNYKSQDVLDIVASINDDDADDAVAGGDVKQQQLHGRHKQHHAYHHHQRQHYDDTTPSLEFTTSSSAVTSSDNEFFIKQQQEQPLIHKDGIYYKTKSLQFPSSSSSSSSSASSYSTTLSTTSKSLLSIHLMKQNVRKRKASSSNSTSMHAETLSKSLQKHTHHSSHPNNNNNRIISTPLLKSEEGNSGIKNNPTDDNFETIYSEGLKNRNSNWNLTTKEADTKMNRQSEQHQNQKNYNEEKPEFNNDDEEQRPQQNYDDYYSDAENDDVDDDGDGDGDDEDDYNEDDGDNDGMSYDDNNNFSDRSYARITRSKLDDDYIDDEPYRNGINELSMQRDAAPGVLTEQKYLDVGNEKAVQQARERYIQDQKRPRTPHELATEHWHRMIQATKCRKPLPRVIPVSNNTSKRYEPYATILHRCGDDTGCCGSTASVCTVKRHEIVMVYVFSYDFNYRKEIEALPMQNHTECHCVNRGSLLHDSMPRDKRSGGSSSYLHHFQRLQRRQQQQQQQHQQHHQFESQAYPQLPSHHQQQWQNLLDCQCPRHFNVFEEDVERRVHLPKPHSVFKRKCRCDCLVNHQTCLRFKHGEEGFSLEDRKCILERICKPPVCSYGEYNLRVGRCPSYRSHLSPTT